MQKYLPKHLAKKSIALPSISLAKDKKDWREKPTSWPDIRKNTQYGHIYLLVDTRYPIGFIATAIDGYSVKIDGIIYGYYANNAQFSIANWADYTATEGYTIDCPVGATKAHIIDICPLAENENITAFNCARVAASGTEAQGVLWIHFNITNRIQPAFLIGRSGQFTNTLAKAITAKNNVLNVSSNMNSLAFGATSLEYICTIDGNNETIQCASSFAGTSLLSKVVIKNLKMTATNSTSLFYNSKVKDVFFHNVDTSSVSNFTNFFALATNIEKLPNGMDLSSSTNMTSFLQNNIYLKDTVLDVSSVDGLTRIGCYGNASNFISGLKGLRVSEQAPFNNATAPQINVSYTGMDRNALVQLFNDLPSVSAGQIISIVGATGAGDLTAEDEAIATNKGWTITK